MKRIIITTAIAALTASSLYATTPSELIEQMRTGHRVSHHATDRATHRSKPSKHRVTSSKRTRHHARKKAHAKQIDAAPRKRTFKTLSDYRRAQQRVATHPKAKRLRLQRKHARSVRPGKPHARYVGNGWYVDEHGQYDEQYEETCTVPAVRPHRYRPQHGYRHYRRQWYLTFLYEKASFVDRHGYFYGYFDKRGFYFDGTYYRYDRAYTYQDRLHGKGLFEHRFYRPRTHDRYAHGRWDTREEYEGGFYVQFTW
jgi:hypothetical protein